MSDQAKIIQAKIQAADSTKAVIEALARAVWFDDGTGTECPAGEIQPAENLAEFMTTDGTLDDVLAEADSRLSAILKEPAQWGAGVVVYEDGFSVYPCLNNPRLVGPGGWARVQLAGDIVSIHRLWNHAGEGRPQHPLAPLVRAWQARRTVQPERRHDPILPRVVISELPDRKAGMLFGGLHEDRRLGHQPVLPLSPEVPKVKLVPLLDLADAAGLPVMARGSSAPLQLRLFIKAIMSVPLENRTRPVVRIAVTVRELVAGLWPVHAGSGGRSGWRATRDWPKLRHALMRARDYGIHDGSGLWFPLSTRRIPDEPVLDELVLFDVALPAGTAHGPIVHMPDMDCLSITRPAAWRACIAVLTLAWVPGLTRVPIPGKKGRGGERGPATPPPIRS